MSQKILQIICTGLATKPDSNVSHADADCGMMGIATSIAPDPIIKAFAYDQNAKPEDTAMQIRGLIQEVKPTHTILHAHSWGNNLAVFFAEWTAEWYGSDQVIDLVVGYDPCVKPGYGVKKWALPASVVRQYRTFYQRGGRPFLVSGTPFEERTDGTGANENVTDWTNPKLAHVSIGEYTGIIMDERVRDAVRRAARDVISGGAV